MTMPRRGRQGFAGQAWGLGRAPGFGGRRLAEMHQQRLQHRLERLAQQQARLTAVLEFLQERSTPEAPPERGRTSRSGRRESPFSGRVPPHGEAGAGGESEGGGDERERGPAGGTSTDSDETQEGSEEADEGSGVLAEEPGEVGGDDALQAALIEVFEELVDRDDPALPKAADINAGLKERGLGPIRRQDARPVYEEWIAGRS
jgi:hypothetical protein